MSNLLSALKRSFGFDHFRDGQEQAVTQLLNGQSTLAIFPTGAGKSLCYQFPALHLPELTIVVSPLLALMKDQLEFLRSKGISAASIDSTLSYEQHQQIIRDVRAKKIKILMVSVERFKNERFRQFIDSVEISMLVVDEAHCISEWGHNFRPDYLKLPAYCQQLNIPLVLLLTATATKRVKQDMANKFAIEQQHIVQTGFYRQNLDLSVLPTAEEHKQEQLLSLINHQQGSGIIYVTLQKTAETVAHFLQQQGVSAQAYHAGFKDDERQSVQHNFMQGNTRIVVATIAFGMGIDKANIRFVIHYDLPKSIENYSQEIGRAGRDGDQSTCYTLANLDSIHTVENFIYGDTPEYKSIEYLLNTISVEVQNTHWEMQVLSLSNACNIKQLPLKTLLVQLELSNILQAKFSYFADFKFKFVTEQAEILQLFSGERAEFLSRVFASAKMKKVWGEPDFDFMLANYNAPRQRIITALEYLADQQHIILETKRATDVYLVNAAALADHQLANKLHQYFLEKEQAEIKRINQLVQFFEHTGCLTHALCHYFDDVKAPENCGHCSVCRGEKAKLSMAVYSTIPDLNDITFAIKQLTEHLQNSKTSANTELVILPLSIEMICRFLSGMTMPIFTRYKVKKLSTFGVCEKMRYAEIKKLVESCLR